MGAVSTRQPATRARRSRTRMSAVERREQLIEIACELFAERGFEGTSVEEIAEYLGVSQPTIARRMQKHGLSWD